MKKLLFALPFAFLLACSNETAEIKKNETVSSKDYLITENSIKNLTNENHQRIKDAKGDFPSYKKYISKLSDDSLTSISYALDYIKTLVAKDNVSRDSVFYLFNAKFYAVVNKFNETFDTKYTNLIHQLEKDSTSAELNAFKENIKECGIGIFVSEGLHYLDVQHDFFYSNFKNRVSEGVAEFLKIRKDELKEGFSEDAGLMISLEDLYKRVKHWENYNTKHSNNLYSEEARGLYTTYLETLMTGMDNSRIFDFEKQELLPEIKSLYEKIIAENPESPTTKIMTSYYNFLSRHDFKDNDSIPLFLQSSDLSSMLAVQPHNR